MLPHLAHATGAEGRRHFVGSDARATGQQFRNGFFDQAAQLWSASGTLLATSSQIVYFKE